MSAAVAITQERLITRLPALAAPFALRPYQHEALAAILAARARGVSRQLAVLPTGAGKTEIFTQLVYRLGTRSLVIAHRDELIEQAADKAWRRAPDGATIGIVKAGRNEVCARLLIASIQTLARPRRLAQLPPVGVVIVDEAHHAAAASYRQVLEHLGCFRPDGPLLVGFTATPDRADGASIGGTVFSEQVYAIGMLDLIEAGYLCDVRAVRIALAADLSRVHTQAGDFRAAELASVLLDAQAPARVVEAYQTYGDDRKTVVFTPTVALAHEVARAFVAAGINAEAADGSSPPEVRRAVLDRFSCGETRVAVNCNLWTEGFDEPTVSCIILCRPTKSRALFTQMIGRGLRLAPGKTDCLILDLAGDAGRHDVASVPDVFGLPAREVLPSVKAGTVQQRIALAREEERRREDLARHRLVSQTLDLFRRRTQGPACHWLSVQPPLGSLALLVLNIGTGILKVGEMAPDVWAVVHEPEHGPRRVIGRQMTQAEAQRLAEAYAATHGKRWAYAAGADWRAKPATQKTRVFARMRHGIAIPAGATAGEASDLITRHMATRQR